MSNGDKKYLEALLVEMDAKALKTIMHNYDTIRPACKENPAAWDEATRALGNIIETYSVNFTPNSLAFTEKLEKAVTDFLRAANALEGKCPSGRDIIRYVNQDATGTLKQMVQVHRKDAEKTS